MPPELDIYGLTKRGDLETINSFLAFYIDREASEDRQDEELMTLPLDAKVKAEKLEDFEWEAARTLSNVIQRGLDYPRRAFSVYLNSKQPEIDEVVLSFTSDDQLIVGLSVDDEEHSPENLEFAKQLLSSLAKQYDCHLGLIALEQPPPTNEREFHRQVDNPYTRFFCEFGR